MDVSLDFERRYRAVQSRDPRFDGYFFTAVTSTGIYCRPSCPARTPAPDNVRFYPTAAAAQAAGFRACKRCIPGAVPGSPEWNLRGDVAGRAMQLIGDGLVERAGVPGLADHLGYSERQLRRVLGDALGAGPLALARAQRAHVARLLLETTALPATEIAFAAGFGSLRQFNQTVRLVFAATPTELRERARVTGLEWTGAGPSRRVAGEPRADGSGGALRVRVDLRLARRDPFDFRALLAFLGPRAIPGVEEVDGETYRRSLRLPHGPALVEATDDGVSVRCRLALTDPRDLAPAVARVRHLLDLDADPVAVADVLGADPRLAPLLARSPGRRAPGAADGAELAIRAVLGQQVSVASARAVAGRLAAAFGSDLPEARGGVIRTFPDAAALAAVDPAAFPVPRARARTLLALAEAVAGGDLPLEAGADRGAVRSILRGIRGVGPWTAGYVAMRALGDPDVLLADDLGVHRALRALGGPESPREISRLGAAWAPWRSYAVHHLWASLPGAGGARSLDSEGASR